MLPCLLAAFLPSRQLGGIVPVPKVRPGPAVLPSLQAYCLAPFDLIKVRLQNQERSPGRSQGAAHPRASGARALCASIFQAEGAPGMPVPGAWALT